MKVLFLDIDGVVTSTRANGFNDFDPFTVHQIVWCCRQADYRIVLSSTWRHAGFSVEGFWQVIFDGLFHEDWRTTSDHFASRRGGQVDEWLSRHPEVTEYVILDDDHDFTDEQKERAVFTDSHNGMLFGHFDRLKELMGIDDRTWPHGEVKIHPLMFKVNQFETSPGGILLRKQTDTNVEIEPSDRSDKGQDEKTV